MKGKIIGFINGFVEFVEAIDDVRDSLENSLVNFAAGIIPWLSSLIPAYYLYVHMTDVLEVPAKLAFVFAAVVEVLGFASISTFLALYRYRQRYKETTTKGSVSPWLAVFAFTMYLIVITLVNGLLGFFSEVDMGQLYLNINNASYLWQNMATPLAESAAVFFLSLLTIPGGVIVAARTQHKEFVTQKHTKTSSKKDSSDGTPKPQNAKSKPSANKQTKGYKLFLEHIANNEGALDNISQLARDLNISRPTATKYKKEYEQNE